jgi:hypothetical protein
LIVIEAGYGVDGNRLDVTRKLNDAIANAALRIAVGNNIAGDPCPNAPKDILVVYSYDGQRLTKRVVEGAVLVLP